MAANAQVREIVINRKWGGFGLSRAAFLRLRELGQKDALAEADVGEMWSDGSGPRKSMGSIDSFGHDIPRDDPLLVQVVREMGVRASGDLAALKIVEVPADVSWEIDNYDGMESVREQHRSWS